MLDQTSSLKSFLQALGASILIGLGCIGVATFKSNTIVLSDIGKLTNEEIQRMDLYEQILSKSIRTDQEDRFVSEQIKWLENRKLEDAEAAMQKGEEYLANPQRFLPRGLALIGLWLLTSILAFLIEPRLSVALLLVPVAFLGANLTTILEIVVVISGIVFTYIVRTIRSKYQPA